jgi:hypothetical protein
MDSGSPDASFCADQFLRRVSYACTGQTSQQGAQKVKHRCAIFHSPRGARNEAVNPSRGGGQPTKSVQTRRQALPVQNGFQLKIPTFPTGMLRSEG